MWYVGCPHIRPTTYHIPARGLRQVHPINPNEGPAGKIIEALQERAKELHCLYRVHELMDRPDVSIDEVCRTLLEVIPPGMQYPGA